MNKPNHYKQILTVLDKLHRNHPNYNLGKHIATALDGSDAWSISDKDFLEALKEYSSELNLDVIHPVDDVEDIIKQGLKLDLLIDDDDNEDEFENY